MTFSTLPISTFDDYELSGEHLNHLFIDRQFELAKINAYKSKKLVAVSGKQGIGKTSFLNKFAKRLDNKFFYVKLTGTTEESIFREVLTSLLLLAINKKIELDDKSGIDFKEHLSRVNADHILSTGGTLGFNKMAVLNWNKSKTISQEKHTEQTAIELIHKISTFLKEDITLIIDDFDGIRTCMRDMDRYAEFVLKVIRVIPTYFKSANLRFILSIEATITDLSNDPNLDEEEANNLIKTGKLIKLKKLGPQHIKEIIDARLRSAKYTGSFLDFIDKDAFWILCFASFGNPRLVLNILQDALLDAQLKKHTKIKLEHIKVGIDELGYKLDPRTEKIVVYLSEVEESYAADLRFQEFVNVSNKTLKAELEDLSENKKIITFEKIKGKNKVRLYKLPNLEY